MAGNEERWHSNLIIALLPIEVRAISFSLVVCKRLKRLRSQVNSLLFLLLPFLCYMAYSVES